MPGPLHTDVNSRPSIMLASTTTGRVETCVSFPGGSIGKPSA